MKRFLYISGIIILVSVLIALFVFVKQYNKPHIDVNSSEPDYTLTVTAIVEDFENDEVKANAKYLDKIIQLEGEITDINLKDGNSIISLSSKNSEKTIICNMNPTENKKVIGLKKGQHIKVRGICTGFLMDVILVRTVIIH